MFQNAFTSFEKIVHSLYFPAESPSSQDTWTTPKRTKINREDKLTAHFALLFFAPPVCNSRYSGTVGCVLDSQVPEVARAATGHSSCKSEQKRRRGTQSEAVVRRRGEKLSSRSRKNREKKKARKKQRRLHVNCTSSGALVNPIPGA